VHTIKELGNTWDDEKVEDEATQKFCLEKKIFKA
jgi:hypothetical protein